MAVTIKSIAEKAGASRGTVDKVLHDRPGVSQSVRMKVKVIADELGYKPNLAGKALAFQKSPLKIGVIILNEEDYVFKEIQKGVEAAYQELRDFGITVETCIMKSQNAEEQLRCINNLKKKKVAAIALSPIEEQIIKDEIVKLSESNIKVVTFNTDIDDIEKICYIGQDAKKSGRVAGHLMNGLLPNGGNVMVLSGVDKLKALNERISGFQEVIDASSPKVKVVKIIKNVLDDTYSNRITSEMVTNHEDGIHAIYVTAGGTGGVGRALQTLNRTDIKVICYDKVPDTIEMLKSNIFDFTITQEPFMQGYLPIKVIFEYFFQKKSPENLNLHTKIEIRIVENLD